MNCFKQSFSEYHRFGWQFLIAHHLWHACRRGTTHSFMKFFVRPLCCAMSPSSQGQILCHLFPAYKPCHFLNSEDAQAKVLLSNFGKRLRRYRAHSCRIHLPGQRKTIGTIGDSHFLRARNRLLTQFCNSVTAKMALWA